MPVSRGAGRRCPIALPAGLAVLVAFQAAFGAWAVTLHLQTAIVDAHLLRGGVGRPRRYPGYRIIGADRQPCSIGFMQFS